VESGGELLTISASIGLSLVSPDHTSVLAVIHGAEHACKLARSEGSNHIRSYHSGDAQLEDVRANMRWAMKLKQALREDALLLYAQPIVASANRDQPRRFEVLVRMRDEGRIVSPGMFLPAIEKHGLATELDRWVVDHTLDYLAALPEDVRSRTERVSVNLSGHSLGSRKFRDYVIDRMQHAPVGPGLVCFEITETAAVVHLDRAVEFIRALRALGVTFALDDFGSGVSSFGYLRSLPVDCLKVDGQFVRHIDTSPLDRGIVTAIHQIAHVMGMETVAEFVENENAVTELCRIGVDYLQGYHLGRPGPLDDYLRGMAPEVEA
jgi:Amt family ammonium transporter